MKWFLGWRQRRAERALEAARKQREALDRDDAEYGGLLLEQTVPERVIEQRIAEMKSTDAERPRRRFRSADERAAYEAGVPTRGEI